MEKEASVDLGLLAKLIELLGLGKGRAAEELTGDVNTQEGTAVLEARLTKLERILAKLIPLEETEHGVTFTDEMKKAIADCSIPTGDTSGEADTSSTSDTSAESDTSKGVEEVIVGDEMEAEEIIERAEILSPGIDIPEGDAATVMPSVMIASLIDAMKEAGNPGSTAKSILGKFADKLPDAPKGMLKAAFIAASDVAKQINNAEPHRTVFSDTKGDSKYVAPRSGADLQAIYRGGK